MQHKVKAGLCVHTQVKHENALQKLKSSCKTEYASWETST